jgi:acylphosphatase
MKKTVHVVISGRVQGVFFRDNTRQQAEMRGVFGWVRNTSDGKVEAVFQGEDDRVDDLISWCYQGSPLSTVSDVSVENIASDESFDSFKIRC